MTIEAYKETTTYKWSKTKTIPEGSEWVDSLEELLPPEFYANGEIVYVGNIKQGFKATHKTQLVYQGIKEVKRDVKLD